MLNEVSLTVGAADFVVVQGKNGCSKIPLLLTLGGPLAPEFGDPVVDSHNLRRMSVNHRAALGANTIGFTLQQFHLVPYLSIPKNMMALTPNVVKVILEHTAELIELCGFSHCTEYTPEEIRAGKRQRTDVAHTMLNRLRLLMADKSTENLDIKNAQCSLEYQVQFTTEGGAELLLATGGCHRTGRKHLRSNQ